WMACEGLNRLLIRSDRRVLLGALLIGSVVVVAICDANVPQLSSPWVQYVSAAPAILVGLYVGHVCQYAQGTWRMKWGIVITATLICLAVAMGGEARLPWRYAIAIPLTLVAMSVPLRYSGR